MAPAHAGATPSFPMRKHKPKHEVAHNATTEFTPEATFMVKEGFKLGHLYERAPLWVCMPTSGKTHLARNETCVFDLESIEQVANPDWRNKKQYLNLKKYYPSHIKKLAAYVNKMAAEGKLDHVDLFVTSIADEDFAHALGYPKFDQVVLRSQVATEELSKFRGGWLITPAIYRGFRALYDRVMYRTSSVYSLTSEEYLRHAYDHWRETNPERNGRVVLRAIGRHFSMRELGLFD